jgi:6-phosphofructokinase 1
LKKVANVEKTVPKKFISKNGFKITSVGRKYLSPLIQGEAQTNFNLGIPDVAFLNKDLLKKKLKKFN